VYQENPVPKPPQPAKSHVTTQERIKRWERFRVLPPAEYDHPYPGNLQIFYVDAETMQFVCPKTPYPVTLACAQRFAPDASAPLGSCHITLALDAIRKSFWTEEIILRHEMGHCNGFSNDHRGARAMTAEEISYYSELEKNKEIRTTQR
jgi:hypothetical protein